jgi:hypothetical protein
MGLWSPRRGRIINSGMEKMVKETVADSCQKMFSSLPGSTDKTTKIFRKSKDLHVKIKFVTFQTRKRAANSTAQHQASAEAAEAAATTRLRKFE